jgi:hypothetical protein
VALIVFGAEFGDSVRINSLADGLGDIDLLCGGLWWVFCQKYVSLLVWRPWRNCGSGKVGITAQLEFRGPRDSC